MYLIVFFCLVGTVFLSGIGYLILRESIIEIGYGRKSGKKARMEQRKQSIFNRLFCVSLTSNVVKKKGAIKLYSALLYTNVIAFIVAILTVIYGIIIRNSDIIFYGGLGIPLCWFLIMIVIIFIPDLIFVPSERKRYSVDDPVTSATGIVFWACVIIGGIIMLIKH